MKPLRFWLTVNAIFSTVSSLLILLSLPILQGWFNAPIAIFLFISAALIFFALFIAVCLIQSDPAKNIFHWMVVFILVNDFLWIILTAVSPIIFNFERQAIYLIWFINSWVGFLLVRQANYWMNLSALKHEFKKVLSVNATPEHIFKTLADIGSISQWNKGLVSSKKTKGSTECQLGDERHCVLPKNHYLTETVQQLSENKSIAFNIDKSSLPFNKAVISFEILPEDNKALVTVSPNYEIKWGGFGFLLNAVFINKQYQQGMLILLQGLKQQVEAKSL